MLRLSICRLKVARRLLVSLLAALALTASPANAEVLFQDDGPLVGSLNIPVYQWINANRQPRATLVLLHGVTLHGTAFDRLARELASQGYLVVAPDLRGFGRWYRGGGLFSPAPEIRYEDSANDIAALLADIHSQYPGVPTICAGESVGCTLALRMAATHKDLVDGLILSGPPVKRWSYVTARSLLQLPLACLIPHHQFDMCPYIKCFVKDERRSADERLRDPVARNSLSLAELVSSNKLCKQTIKYARAMPPETPVLILQGTDDKMMKAQGASLLFSELPTRDKRLHWFPRKGHLLLETSYITPDVLDAVGGWLERKSATQTAERPDLRSMPLADRGN